MEYMFDLIHGKRSCEEDQSQNQTICWEAEALYVYKLCKIMDFVVKILRSLTERINGSDFFFPWP